MPVESILESSISENSLESSDGLYEEMSREEAPEQTSGGVNRVIPLVIWKKK